MKDGVILLSGGIDSMVLLAQECSKGLKPLCISFTYGQRHVREMNAAAWIADYYKVERIRIDLPDMIFAGGALTGQKEVPTGPERNKTDTVVPNRNMVFIASAAAIAFTRKYESILFACHKGPTITYADCTPEFVRSMDRTLKLTCGVSVKAPFVNFVKREIVQLGRKLNVPLEMSWSCFVGGDRPCGVCGACILRNEAMQ